MKKRWSTISAKLLISVLVLCLHSATSQGADDLLSSSQDDLFVVLGVGAAGGVLGLSTLSFMDEPQDHLKNIWVGASIGVILGVAIIAYNQAARSHELFYEKALNSPLFDTSQRLSYHQDSISKHLTKGPVPWAYWSYPF